jgi:putative membrane protein
MHMFNDGYYMGGMHGGWWLFWLLAILAVGATVLLEVLRHRLASGGITPAQYEEHKALLDRDGPPPG